MAAVSEQEEFEFRLRAEREAAAGAPAARAPAPAAPSGGASGSWAPTSSSAGGVGRAVEFHAGNLDAGIAGLLGIPVDTALNVADLIKAGAGTAQHALGGKAESMPELTDRSQVPGSSEYLEGVMRQAGVITPNANPTNEVERIVAAAERAAPSVLAARPGSAGQVVKGALAAGTSGALAQGAQEAGLPPSAQQIAGMSPTLVRQAGAGTAELARRGVVGKEDVRKNIVDAENAGVKNPSAGMVTKNRMVAGAEGTLARLPGAGGVMDEAAVRRAEGMRTKTQEVVERLSPEGSVSTERAGRNVVAGVQGAVERFRANQKRLYTKVDEMVPAGKPINLSNYRRVLREIAGPIRGAEASGKALVPGDVKALHEALETDLAAVGPQGKPEPEIHMPAKPKAPAEGASLRAKREYRQALEKWRADTAKAEATRDAMAAQPETVRTSVTNRQGEKLERIDRDVEVSRIDERGAKNSLPYEAVKGVRSVIGGKLDDLMLTDKAVYKKLYRALSDDIRASLPPDAKRAWDRANKYTSAGHDRIDTVYQPLVDKATPEKALKAAMGGNKEGASALRKILAPLKPEQRNAVAAHVIEQMGKSTPSTQDATGARFSPETFLTNWSRMHPDAQRALFGTTGTLKDMQTLADAASAMREAGRGTANPSGTARAVTHAGFAGAGMYTVMTYLLGGAPGAALGAAGGLAAEAGINYALARAMTSPQFVHWLAEGTKVPPTADPAAFVARLSAVARNTKDPETKEAIEDIFKALSARSTTQQR